ncbi:MAG: hypothetical protein K0S61_3710 [Anaerocolumna sp.]|jgi:hypothetical protein|nr:hypothetical protein [Anaerocolumna sp.]
MTLKYRILHISDIKIFNLKRIYQPVFIDYFTSIAISFLFILK